MNWKLCAVLLFGLGLQGCDNFHPLLSQDTHCATPTANLLSLSIERIPERSGQKLRQFLMERLTPEPVQNPVYTLKTTLTDTQQQLGIQKDATTLRMRHVITVAYQLIHCATGKVCHEQTLTTYASYHFVEDRFYSNTVSQQSSFIHALRNLADLIRLDLAIFAQRQPLNTPQAKRHET